MTDLDPALIEKAAKAHFRSLYGRDEVPESFDQPRMSECRAAARAVLEAVAGDLRADALREAADWLEMFRPFPGDEVESLRERADQISPKEEQ